MSKVIDCVIAIDGYLIDRVESFCHKLQQWTGVNNFTLARLCTLLFSCVLYMRGHSIVGISSIVFIWILLVYISEIHTDISLDHKMANPMKYNPGIIFWRLVNIIVLIKSCVVTRKDIITDFLTAMFLVLLACTPLPPSMSKLKSFIKSLLGIGQKEPVHVPS